MTHGEARPDIMLEICGRAEKNLREALGKANSLANYARSTGGGAGAGAQLRHDSSPSVPSFDGRICAAGGACRWGPSSLWGA